jgi:prepilin-type N-terminal cleavage/methylation domain-containing protein
MAINYGSGEFVMKNSRKRKHLSQDGFTLIEIMMAMVILGIGIMSFVTLQTADVVRNSNSKKQTQGYVWAMDQIEGLLGLDYTDADLTLQGSSAVVGDGHIVARVPYTVEWDVINNTANVANSKLVNVFVRWNGQEVARVDFTRVATSF